MTSRPARDIIAQAQSGTGKTGAFVTGTLEIIDEKVYNTQAIILAPTLARISNSNKTSIR